MIINFYQTVKNILKSIQSLMVLETDNKDSPLKFPTKKKASTFLKVC